MFDSLTNGKDVWIRSEMDEQRQGFFDKVAEKMGVTNGQITREQFNNYRSQKTGDPSGSTGKSLSTGAASDPRDRSGNQPGSGDMSRAEAAFRHFDKNGDGVLSFDEMPEELKANIQTWDVDGNGFIDLNEFKAFYQAWSEQRMVDRGLSNSRQAPLASSQPAPRTTGRIEERKPLVYHADNLPKELPPWFKDLDTNRDAQVSLYEWKNSGRSIADFLAMDRNNDGFLTVEEVLDYEARKGSDRSANNGQSVTSRSSPVVRSSSR